MPAAEPGTPAAYLRAVKSRLHSPPAIAGRLYHGPACLPDGDLLWEENLSRRISYRLPQQFRRELQLARFPVPPSAAAHYDGHKDGSEDGGGGNGPGEYLEIDMHIEQVAADICMQDDGLSGSAAMRVSWQMYFAGMPTILHEAVTQGFYKQAAIEKTTVDDLFEKSFSAAAKEFLNDARFRKAAARAASR